MNLTIEANTLGGATVTLPQATATDDADPNPQVREDQSSGFFPLGTTVVNVTATDASGNSSSSSFILTVVDTTPPMLTMPADLVIVANALDEALVTLPQATATDVADPNPLVNEDQSSGFFPLGTTTVNVTATDASGNSSIDSFTVTVVDNASNTAIIPAITQIGPDRAEGTPIAVTGSAINRDSGNFVTGLTYVWTVYKDEESTRLAAALEGI